LYTVLRNAPKNVKVMAKWVGELSTGSSLVQIGDLESRPELSTMLKKEEALQISSKKTKNQKPKIWKSD
jgi:hypothetical protein